MPPNINFQTLVNSIGSQPSMSADNPDQIMDTGAMGIFPSIETDDFKDLAQVDDTIPFQGLDSSSTSGRTQGLAYQHVDDPTEEVNIDVYEHQDEGLPTQLTGERTLRMMAEERVHLLEVELKGERERHARQLVEVVRHSLELHVGMQTTTQDIDAYETPSSMDPRQNTATYGGPVDPLLGQTPAKKRGRGRPRKVTRESEVQADAGSITAEPEVQPKRERGRPRKITTEADQAGSPTNNDAGTVESEAQPKRGRGRPKKQVEATKVVEPEYYDQDSSSSKRVKFGLPGQSNDVDGPKATRTTLRVSEPEASIVVTIADVSFGTFGGISLPASVVANLENKVAEWQSKHKNWESHYQPGSSQCVNRKASGSSGRSAWTANNAKRVCCRGCFNGQSVCVIWVYELDMFVVLPLPEEARVGKTSDEEGYWLYPKENASRKILVSPNLAVWE